MVTWQSDGEPKAPVPIGPLGWLRIALRGGAILLVLAVCFPLLLLLRLPEQAIFGARRPVTPWITQAVCIWACFAMGLRRRVTGKPMTGVGAHLANHASWLDIFVLNSGTRAMFVAKSEVRGWGGIGWLARATGTIFIERRREAARVHAGAIEERLHEGHRLIVFPEGTSTDGQRVLPFKSTIFAAFFTNDVPKDMQVQPVTLRYHAPKGREARFYGWWGDAGFGESLLQVLAQAPQGSVDVIWHAPIPADGHDRKSLAKAAEEAVRQGFETR